MQGSFSSANLPECDRPSCVQKLEPLLLQKYLNPLQSISLEGVPGSPGKSQEEGQEDQGEVEELEVNNLGSLQRSKHVYSKNDFRCSFASVFSLNPQHGLPGLEGDWGSSCQVLSVLCVCPCQSFMEIRAPAVRYCLFFSSVLSGLEGDWGGLGGGWGSRCRV